MCVRDGGNGLSAVRALSGRPVLTRETTATNTVLLPRIPSLQNRAWLWVRMEKPSEVEAAETLLSKDE